MDKSERSAHGTRCLCWMPNRIPLQNSLLSLSDCTALFQGRAAVFGTTVMAPDIDGWPGELWVWVGVEGGAVCQPRQEPVAGGGPASPVETSASFA